MENFRWCLRAGCTNGQIHESGIDGPIFRCASCGFGVCVIHNTPWHEGETCTEYDYRTDKSLKRKEEEASKVTIEKTTKKCPKRTCGANIEKIDGCDHMTCKITLQARLIGDSADLQQARNVDMSFVGFVYVITIPFDDAEILHINGLAAIIDLKRCLI